MADLLELNLQDQMPFLAYLSACGTGQGQDDSYLDESIHLINAFQIAGFRHVIGALWGVEDKLCVRMICQETEENGISDVSICLGLHRATKFHRDYLVNGSTADYTKGSQASPLNTNLESTDTCEESNTGIIQQSNRMGRDVDMEKFRWQGEVLDY